jgi:pimeloyl-ACP methyl ester carboxylesterase
VMVLHGWFGDHSIWSPTYPLLDRDSFSYAFMDDRGYGSSRGLAGAHTMAEIAADAVALADRLGWEQFAVVGHSMGGMAAQRLAIDAPTRVTALVCVTPVPASGVKLPPEVAALFEAAVRDDAAARDVIEVSLGARLTPALSAHVLALQRRTARPDAFSDYLRAFTQGDFSSEAGALRAPLLVLVGEHDGGVSLEFAQTTFPVLYPQAVLLSLPNAGHYPMVETPAYLVTVIERFLQQGSPAA